MRPGAGGSSAFGRSIQLAAAVPVLVALALLCSPFRPAQAGPSALDLEPVLLRDADEMRRYVAAFPFEDYKRIPYPNMGCRLSPAPSTWLPCLFDWWQEPLIGRFWVERSPPRSTVKNPMMSGRVWEPHVVRRIQAHARPGSVALDVGAYMGGHSMLMGRLVGRAGKVYAFEPQRKMFRELVWNIALSGMDGVVVPLRYAVGDRTDVIEMNCPIEVDGWGPGGVGVALVEGGVGIGAGCDRAELRPLDDFGFSDVSLIKIDVEGHENAVLEGAKETIAGSRPAVILEILNCGAVAVPGAPAMGLPLADAEQLGCIHATWRLLQRHGYQVRPIQGHDYIALPLEHPDAPVGRSQPVKGM